MEIFTALHLSPINVFSDIEKIKKDLFSKLPLNQQYTGRRQDRIDLYRSRISLLTGLQSMDICLKNLCIFVYFKISRQECI
jgi:hypothetical protein